MTIQVPRPCHIQSHQTMLFVATLLSSSGLALSLGVQDRVKVIGDELKAQVNDYQVDTPAPPDQCIFDRACQNNQGFGVYNGDFSMDGRFPNAPVDPQSMIFKHPPTDQTIPSKDICRIQSRMFGPWQETLAGNDVLWQYAGLDNGLTGWYPAMDWEKVGAGSVGGDACPGDYRVEERPWFKAGRSGQFDMAFMVDLTGSPEDVATMLEFVDTMIQTFSFRHYANVVVYNSAPIMASDKMKQINLDDLITGEGRGMHDMRAAAKRLIKKSGNRAPNLASALRATLDMLASSKATDDSSHCDQFIVMLSSGTFDGLSRELRDTFYGDVRVMSMVTDSDDSSPATLGPKTIACASRGFTLVNPTVPKMIDSVYQFLSAGIQGDVSIRASEVYSDHFTGLPVTSVVNPIEKGMLAIDIKLDNLNASTATVDGIDQINSELLSTQECESRNTPYSETLSIQGGEDFCEDIADNDSRSGKNPLDDNRPAIISVTVIFIYIIYAILLYWTFQMTERGYLAAMVIVSMVLLWPLFFGLLYDRSALWDDMVQFKYWKPSTITTESRDVTPFRCCDIVNCQCQNVNAPTCGSLRNSLVEGVCNNGYHCCREECYTCNCHTSCNKHSCSTYCSTCCYCAKSVSRRRCESVCGTCQRVTFELSFRDVQGNLRRTTAGTICRRQQNPPSDPDNIPCVSKFSSTYLPIGKELHIYYNPESPTEITHRIAYDKTQLGFFITSAILLAIFFMCIIARFVKEKCTVTKSYHI